MGIPQFNAKDQFSVLAEVLSDQGIDVEGVKDKLKAQEIETPSWGYGNSGTRFGVFKQPGAARDVHERLSDAAQVHKMTGVCPGVALHIPWDKVDDYDALQQEAAELGVHIGAINPNVFQEYDYKLGSFGHRDPNVRQKALDHMYECIDIMQRTNSKVLSLWFADGTNYPGQDDIIERKRRFEECLGKTHAALPDDSRMLIEYKFFEPAFYHTDIADWGMALNFALKAGPKAEVLVDLGHHPLCTNIEHLVALLLDEERLGGFHFNNCKYADDDVTTGSVNLYEVFLIYHEILNAERRGTAANIAYMIDQSHIIKPKVEAMIQSVLNIQTAYARALLVDRAALAATQAEDDTVAGEEILRNAYDVDVRPLLAVVREELGAEADPLRSYRESGYFKHIAEDRQGELEGAASWG
ncbi:MAG: L-rhamnose isomerase [Gemmatimonadetes bacterium]|jgi:L-rhamnose isomerase / sugar isomerase|nr:L-rhamnose isomerase [Gemmatimonadota bacterium]MBT5328384.1 L-rhamnose isomerase [Gemmatimonadota bacterium]MBT5451492.1 L-rhamnose isomerase [Gemmatimonadota bacterium]MBT5803149.1 L-rhamnose isomerase [Gemmatimonadota bacterium]MBT6622214.1 L-rhamnose isomerase [Gemmatimonadota bacterium]